MKNNQIHEPKDIRIGYPDCCFSADDNWFRYRTGVDYEVDRLAIICENFFKENSLGYNPLHCHVIEFYYLMKSRGKKDAKCGSVGWDNAKESIHWIPLDKLAETDIRPEFLRTRIKDIIESKGLIHIVNDER